jgi:hypothetical protein
MAPVNVRCRRIYWHDSFSNEVRREYSVDEQVVPGMTPDDLESTLWQRFFIKPYRNHLNFIKKEYSCQG